MKKLILILFIILNCRTFDNVIIEGENPKLIIQHEELIPITIDQYENFIEISEEIPEVETIYLENEGSILLDRIWFIIAFILFCLLIITNIWLVIEIKLKNTYINLLDETQDMLLKLNTPTGSINYIENRGNTIHIENQIQLSKQQLKALDGGNLKYQNIEWLIKSLFDHAKKVIRFKTYSDGYIEKIIATLYVVDFINNENFDCTKCIYYMRDKDCIKKGKELKSSISCEDFIYNEKFLKC